MAYLWFSPKRDDRLTLSMAWAALICEVENPSASFPSVLSPTWLLIYIGLPQPMSYLEKG